MLTPQKHFNEDLGRSHELLEHALTLPDGTVRDDVLRAAWMMAVGASDAYFSDAYADLLTRTLRASSAQPDVAPSARLKNLKVPLMTVVKARYTDRPGWQWRMVARQLIEEETVLSVEKIRALFNQFCHEQRKLLNQNTIEPWIIHRDAKKRMFGITPAEYGLTNNKSTARNTAMKTLEWRFEQVFQRRHDCIHNCDRPRVALQSITDAAALKAIQDIEFLVARCEETLQQEFPDYVKRLGFSKSVQNAVLTGFAV